MNNVCWCGEIMGRHFHSDETTNKFGPKNEREAKIFAEENLRVDIQCLIRSAMIAESITKEDLAYRLGVETERVTAYFEPDYDLTMREFAQIVDALDHEPEIVVRPTGMKGSYERAFDEARDAAWWANKKVNVVVSPSDRRRSGGPHVHSLRLGSSRTTCGQPIPECARVTILKVTCATCRKIDEKKRWITNGCQP